MTNQLDSSKKYFRNAKPKWAIYYNNYFKCFAPSRAIARREVFECHPMPKDVIFVVDNDDYIKAQDKNTKFFSEAKKEG